MQEDIKKIWGKLSIYQDYFFEKRIDFKFYKKSIYFFFDSISIIENKLNHSERQLCQECKSVWDNFNGDKNKLSFLRSKIKFDTNRQNTGNLLLHLVISYEEYVNDKDNQFDLLEIFIFNLSNVGLTEYKIITLLKKHFDSEISLSRGIHICKEKPDDWEYSYESCEFYYFENNEADKHIYSAFGVPYRQVDTIECSVDVVRSAFEQLKQVSELDDNENYQEFKNRMEKIDKPNVWIEFI